MVVRKGFEVITPTGETMSVDKPGARDIIIRRSGGGAVPTAQAPPKPIIKRTTTEVFIDGEGFSVRASDQQAFLQQRGLSFSPSQLQEIRRDIELQEQREAQRLAEQGRLEQQRRLTERQAILRRQEREEEKKGFLRERIERFKRTGIGGRLTEFEIRKAEEKRRLFEKFQRGEKLTFIERQKIAPLIREQQERPETEGQRAVAKLDSTIAGFIRGGARKVEPFFPEDSVESKALKDLLFTEVEGLRQPRASEILKFGFFLPAFASTQTATEQAVATGQIKPEADTKFLSDITQLSDDVSRVRVITETKAGGKTIGGVSKQVVRDVSDDVVFGAGKGFIVESQKGGRRIVTRFDIAGATKQLGKAGVVKDITSLTDDVSRISTRLDLGARGVQARTITQETEKIVFKEGIGGLKDIGGVPSRTILPRTEPVRITPTGKVIIKTTAKPQDLTGVIKQIDDTTLSFIGQTGKPVTRISPEGITKIIREPNVRGFINIKTGDIAGKGVKFLQPRQITKTALTKTFTQETGLTTAQQTSAVKQLSGLVGKSEKALLSSITAPTISKEISKVLPASALATEVLTKPKTRFKDQTKQLFADLGVSETKFKTGVLGKTAVRQETRQRTKLKTLLEEKTLLRELLGQPTKQTLKVRQAQAQKLKLRTKLKLKQKGRVKTPFVSPLKIKIKETDLFPIIFPFLKPSKIKKKKKRPRGKPGIEEALFVPGATARFLNIRKILSPADIKRLSRDPLSIRPIPILSSPKKRKKKKRKRS